MQQVDTQPEEQQPLFRDRPVRVRCPNCLSKTVSDIVLKAQYSTIIFSALVFLLLPNIINIIAMMFAFVATSVKKHRCSACQFQLGTDGKFLICLQDEVYSFNAEKSGIIFTKKILVSIALTILAILIVIYYGVTNPRTHPNFTDVSWGQFIKQCQVGKERSAAQEACEQKYEMRSFMNWNGSVVKVKDNRQSYARYIDSEIMIYVKMSPEIKPHQPDILLEFDKLATIKKEKQVQKLHHGDMIRFNATFSEFVNQGSSIKMYVTDFQKVRTPEEIKGLRRSDE